MASVSPSLGDWMTAGPFAAPSPEKRAQLLLQSAHSYITPGTGREGEGLVKHYSDVQIGNSQDKIKGSVSHMQTQMNLTGWCHGNSLVSDSNRPKKADVSYLMATLSRFSGRVCLDHLDFFLRSFPLAIAGLTLLVRRNPQSSLTGVQSWRQLPSRYMFPLLS